jgi:hypothetical protein
MNKMKNLAGFIKRHKALAGKGIRTSKAYLAFQITRLVIHQMK